MARKKHGELQPVIKKWEVHRRTTPFPVWKHSLMLMNEEDVKHKGCQAQLKLTSNKFSD